MVADEPDRGGSSQSAQERLEVVVAVKDALEERLPGRCVRVRSVAPACQQGDPISRIVRAQFAGAKVDGAALGVQQPGVPIEVGGAAGEPRIR